MDGNRWFAALRPPTLCPWLSLSVVLAGAAAHSVEAFIEFFAVGEYDWTNTKDNSPSGARDAPGEQVPIIRVSERRGCGAAQATPAKVRLQLMIQLIRPLGCSAGIVRPVVLRARKPQNVGYEHIVINH